MKYILGSVMAAAVLLALAGNANGQIFGPSISATQDSDVINVGFGGTAFAFDFTDMRNTAVTNPTTTVNNVVFAGSFANATTGVSFSYAGLGSGDYNGVNGTALEASGGSAQYVSILKDLVYGGSATPATLTFTGLKPGNKYELQVFAGGGQNNSETLTDASTIPGPTPPSPSGTLNYGYPNNPAVTGFINEKFKAPLSGIETITLSSNTGALLVFDAVNLQDLSAVPEPSTYALMIGGLAFLGLCVRRKSVSAK